MKGEAKVGGRRTKNDPRELRSWVGKLTLEATQEGEQFILAALYNLIFHGEGSQALRNALKRSAKGYLKVHQKREKERGVTAMLPLPEKR